MQGKAKITPFQFYTVLFLGRFFSAVAHGMEYKEALGVTDGVIATLIMGALLLLTTLPTALLIKKDSSSSVITRASCLSDFFSKVLCAVYLVDFLYYGIVNAARFQFMAGSVMFPEGDMTVFILVILAGSAYAAYKGIEALGRSAVVFLLPVALSVAFVFVASVKSFDMVNFTPAFNSDIENIITAAVLDLSKTGDLLAVSVLLPFLKNGKAGHPFVWSAVVTASVFLVALFSAGVLGQFAQTQMFTMYTMSVLAEFGILQRLDALITCLWMLCAGVRLSTVFFLCDLLLTELFGKSRRAVYLGVSGVLIFAGTLLVTGSVAVFTRFSSSAIAPVLYLATSCLVPLSVMAGEKIKGRKKDEKA